MAITIAKALARMLKRFKNWLNNCQHFLFSWYTEDSKETQEPERKFIELPVELRKKLVEAVENLPSNPADKKEISSKLDEAFELWRKKSNNPNNSIVILSSPITTVSRILTEILQGWAEQKRLSMRLLPLTARPDESKNIKSELEHYLEQKSTENDSDRPLEIVAIPNLSWYFLRSVEGLEGIEYLQSLICNNSKNRFWIIGGGHVGWEYLNSVCALEAYCGEVFTLPGISPESMQQWLDPIVNQLDITFDEPRLDQQILDGNKDNKTSYFNLLTDISQGVSTVAVQVLLQSICYREVDTEDESKPKQKILVAQTPKLNKLPAFESTDRYILYSLLLHGDLTISALAESLGDESAEVQTRIQVLRHKGLVQQRDKVLKINPIHYPKLKQELASNNFIISRR